MPAAQRRRLATVAGPVAVTLLVTATLLVVAPAPLRAQPGAAPIEGGPPLLSEVLEAAGRRYLAAQAAAADSEQRQRELTAAAERARARADDLAPQAGRIATASYRVGRIGPVSSLLNNALPDAFLARVVALDELNRLNIHQLDQLIHERDRARAAKEAADAEVERSRTQREVMRRQKEEAEKALALVGGRSLTDGFVAAESPVAAAAPRNADGSWPVESCTERDPTTSGCLTPRTLHAYREVKKAGFDKFVSCHRPGGPYEHPKGRACDWALLPTGFRPAATDAQRLYGNNLAAFLVRNADRLGILYVIWYRQIWFPATGWSAYVGDNQHTDHVHMSVL
jgi:hypothetical protein